MYKCMYHIILQTFGKFWTSAKEYMVQKVFTVLYVTSSIDIFSLRIEDLTKVLFI